VKLQNRDKILIVNPRGTCGVGLLRGGGGELVIEKFSPF
jgi:hypothetical protein